MTCYEAALAGHKLEHTLKNPIRSQTDVLNTPPSPLSLSMWSSARTQGWGRFILNGTIRGIANIIDKVVDQIDRLDLI